ncbi:MAG: hypothetical protein ACREN6_15985 [Gemmatimonadaceae bacterium]
MPVVCSGDQSLEVSTLDRSVPGHRTAVEMAYEIWLRESMHCRTSEAVCLGPAGEIALRWRIFAPHSSMCASRHAGTAFTSSPRRRASEAPDRALSAGNRIPPIIVPFPRNAHCNIRGPRGADGVVRIATPCSSDPAWVFNSRLDSTSIAKCTCDLCET